MNHSFTIYSAFFLTVALISFFVALLAWQRRSVISAKELTLLMIAAGIWSFWIIFETAAQSIILKIFWSKLEYIGAVSTPVLFLIFVLRFTGKGKLITKKNILLLCIIPVITLLVAITNEKHNLLWSGFSTISDKTNIMQYYHGLWFWIGYMAYNYLLFIVATIYLISFITHNKQAFRTQGLIIFIAGVCPWIASILYLFEINPVSGIDLTPISIILSGSLFAFAILYTPFLDLVPVARETLVEILPDGILVLDGQNRILDINEAALLFLGIRDKNIIGIHAEYSDASVKSLLDAVLDQESNTEINILDNNEIATYRIIKQKIRGHPNSRLVVIHNITETKKAEASVISLAKRNQTLLLTASDGIHILDDQGRVEDVNPAFCRMLGYTREELLRLNVADWDMQWIDSKLFVKIRELIKNPAVFETQHRRKDGSIIDVEINATGIMLEGRNYLYASARNITERKLSEHTLQTTLSLLDSTLESIHNGILVINHQGVVIKANAKFAELWRIPSEKIALHDDKVLLDHILEQLVQPEEFIAKVNELYENRESESYDLIHFKDGRIFERISKPMYIGDKTEGRVWSFHDITERKKAEEALKESEEKYRLMLKNSNDVLMLVNENGIPIFVSDATKNAKEFSDEELRKPITSVIYRDDLSIVMEAWNRILRSRDEIIRVQYRHKDNDHTWLEAVAQNYLDHPAIKAIVINIRDITERKQAEEAIKESEAKFKSLFEGANDAIFILDGSKFIECNQKAELLFQCTREELIGHLVSEFSPAFQPSGQPSTIAIEKINLALDDKPQVFEWNHLRLDGTFFDAEVSLSKIEIKDKVYIQAIVRDTTERKQIENALKVSESKFRAILENSYDAIGVHVNGVWEMCNPAALRLFGISTPEELYGTPILNVIAPNERDRIRGFVRNRTEDINIPMSYVTRGLRRDGTEFDMDMTLSTFTFDKKQNVLVVMRDITARKQDEEKLKASEERFRNFVSHSPNIIYKYSNKRGGLFWSERVKDILGFDPVEIQNNPFLWSNLIHPDDKETVQRAVEENEKGAEYNIEYRIKTKDGKWIWLHDRFIHKTQIGDEIIIEGTATDITERKKAKEELQRISNQLSGIIEGTKDVVALMDTNYNYILFNSAFHEEFKMIFGKDLKEGDSMVQALENLPNDLADAMKYWNRALGGEDFTVTQQFGDEKLARNWYELHFSPIRDDQGKVKGAVHIVRNTNERKQLELKIQSQNQELSKLNSDKDRFMSILAHDLKSPFNGLLGLSELLIENIRKYDINKIETCVKYIYNSTHSSYNLLEDLLMWAKSQSGKIDYEPQKVNFNEICTEVLEMLEPLAHSKNISINHFSTSDLSIYADINMIKTILRNLISNSIKFTASGGQIKIIAEKGDSNITVAVSDNGIGMTHEELGKLFDITQTHTTKGTANETGTGLGLFLCKDFVEKHGGEIWVHSELNKETTFYFTIPRS